MESGTDWVILLDLDLIHVDSVVDICGIEDMGHVDWDLDICGLRCEYMWIWMWILVELDVDTYGLNADKCGLLCGIKCEYM